MRQADTNREARERPRTQHTRRNLYFLLWLRIPREALTTPTGCRLSSGGPQFHLQLLLATNLFWLFALHSVRRGAWRRYWKGCSFSQRCFCLVRQLVSMLQQLRYLPHLRRREHVLKAGHSRQPNSVFYFPVDL